MTLIIPVWALVVLIICIVLRVVVKTINSCRLLKQLLDGVKYLKKVNALDKIEKYIKK